MAQSLLELYLKTAVRQCCREVGRSVRGIPGLFGGGGWIQQLVKLYVMARSSAHRKWGWAVLLGWWHLGQRDAVLWKWS